MKSQRIPTRIYPLGTMNVSKDPVCTTLTNCWYISVLTKVVKRPTNTAIPRAWTLTLYNPIQYIHMYHICHNQDRLVYVEFIYNIFNDCIWQRTEKQTHTSYQLWLNGVYTQYIHSVNKNTYTFKALIHTCSASPVAETCVYACLTWQHTVY